MSSRFSAIPKWFVLQVFLFALFGAVVFAQGEVESREAALSADLAAALSLAQSEPHNVCRYLGTGKINIANEKDRIRFALAAASHPNNVIAACIDDLKITDSAAIVEIAAAVAQSRPTFFDSCFEKFGITDPATIIKLVKIAAQNIHDEHTQVLLANFEKYGITDKPALLEIAKILARKNGYNVIRFIDKFQVTDPTDRTDLACEAVATSFTDLEKVISAFHITEYKDRLRVALAGASNPLSIGYTRNDISLHLEQFDITDADDLFEIAKRAAATNGSSLSQHIKKYKINDPTKLKEIALIAAQNSAFGVSEFIQNYGFTEPDDLFEIAKTAFSTSASASRYIENYGITDQARLVELAELAIQNDSDTLFENINRFKIVAPEVIIKFAKIAAQHNGETTARHLRYSGITDKSAILEIARLCIVQLATTPLKNRVFKYSRNSPFTDFHFTQDYLNQLFLSLDPEAALQVFVDANTASSIEEEVKNLPEGEANRERLKKQVAVLLNSDHFQNKGLKDFAGTALLWNRVVKREVVLMLLGGLAELALDPKNESILVALKDDPDSLILLAALTGLPQDLLKNVPSALSMDRLGTFFELAGELNRQVSPFSSSSAFERLRFDALIFKRQGIGKLMDWLEKNRDLLALTPAEERASLWRSLHEQWQAAGVINLENVATYAQSAKDRIVSRIQKLFAQTDGAVATDGSDVLTFSYEDFEWLKETWGDISPVFTLLARFQGNLTWRKEIPLLKRVFAAVLAGRFNEFKFEGFMEQEKEFVQRQIGFLNEKALTAWKATYHRINLWRPSAESAQVKKQSHLSAAWATLNTNLNVHLDQMNLNPGILVAGLSEKIKDIVSGAQAPPKDVLKSIEQLAELQVEQELKNQLILQALRDAFHSFDGIQGLDDDSARKIQSLATFLEFFLNFTGTAPGFQLNLDLFQQIKTDLSTMIGDLRQAVLAGQEQLKGAALVFTTTFHDAKLLLSIGDLVNASSCQNFKTGSHIETLLGYVVDANVQGIASFVFTVADFEKAKDFDVLTRAMDSGINLTQHLRFDPNKKKLYFEFTLDGIRYSIESKSKDYAHRRHVLKLGKTSAGQPGIRTERAYLQGHGAGAVMEQQVSEVTDEMRSEMGLSPSVLTEPLQISKSSNPGGVYSDSARGVQTGAYVLPP